MFSKQFSTDSTTFGTTCNQIYRNHFNFEKEKWPKNVQKYCSYAIEIFSTLVLSMVISPLLRTVAEIKKKKIRQKPNAFLPFPTTFSPSITNPFTSKTLFLAISSFPHNIPFSSFLPFSCIYTQFFLFSLALIPLTVCV